MDSKIEIHKNAITKNEVNAGLGEMILFFCILYHIDLSI